VLAFEGTHLSEGTILRSMSGGNSIFRGVVSPIGAGVWWSGSVAFSGFAISAPIFEVLPVAVRRRTGETDSEERTPGAGW